MIFVDTSAFFALADRNDNNHAQAKKIFARLLKEGEELIFHNYVLVETVALMQQRLGKDSAVKFLEDASFFSLVWADARLHEKAKKRFVDVRRGVSFVDSMSFVVMEARGIKKAFAFDDDFVKAGFQACAAV